MTKRLKMDNGDVVDAKHCPECDLELNPLWSHCPECDFPLQ